MGRARQTAGVLAKRARYDPRSKRLRIELESGVEVRIPVAKVQGLADAPAAVIRTVRVEGGGYGLHWPALDLDLSVAGLVAGRFGTRTWMAALGQHGVDVESPAKRRVTRGDRM